MSEVLQSPSGWFAIGLSEDFPREQAVPAHWFDQDLVVFRSADDTLAALDAYCPHLGAHLGYGGTVNDGSITCPFHGWRWAADGTCLSVPYGNRNTPKVRVPSVPIVEQDGVVLLWRGVDSPPTWTMPRYDDQRWTEPVIMRRTMRSHPQEVLENTADLAHFRFVHQTHMMEATTEVRTEGNVFELSVHSAPDAVEPAIRLTDDVLIEGGVFCHGPGLAGATITAKGMPIHALQRLYATPIGNGEVNLLGLVNIRLDDNCDQAAADSLMPILSTATIENWDRDIEIWQHKRHLRQPVLNPKERVVWAFRRWYAQYYDGASPYVDNASLTPPSDTSAVPALA
ncbi:Rieske 2Fe-2S domain-containing protein [soil metagenome]